MENRKSKRVECFQLGGPRGIEPVWIIQHATPDAVLGLLVDISEGGVQILTRKESVVQGKPYQLTVETDERERVMTAVVIPKRSEPDGTLYIRSGFLIEEHPNAKADMDKVLASQKAGHVWLRCELVPT